MGIWVLFIVGMKYNYYLQLRIIPFLSVLLVHAAACGLITDSFGCVVFNKHHVYWLIIRLLIDTIS